MGKITEALRKAAEDRLERTHKKGRIPGQKKIGDSKVDTRLVTYFDPKALITEQYKILRTNILSTNSKRPLKTLVVTSSLHSEGKTVTALNLAMVIAQSTQKPKVLVVDADMRRGRMTKYLGVDHPMGLTEILTDKIDTSEALFHTDMENLAFIAAGSVAENPAELLGSNRMLQFLAD